VGFGDKVSDELLQKLKSFAHQRSEPHSHIRQAAVKALKFSGDNRAGQIVARALTCDPCHVVREVAAETLLVWNCAETERALIDGLADDFWKTRKAAARTLATFIIRYGVYDSAAVCEALTRMERMFPQASRERRLIQRAKVHLKYSGSPQIR
jgi:HEAT repeat protein